MIIRSMTRQDTEAVLGMMRTFYASPAVLSSGSEEIFCSDIENCVGDSPYLEGYILEEEGEAAGYAMAARSFSAEFGKPCVWVEDLYIREPFRGRGFGTAFLNHMAESNPGAVIRLEVEEENRKAIRVYQKCGFEVLPYMQMKRM